ncbi:hypothetical protein Godav_010331 [Gossypium davidsonii]|uniref:Uncharacterized protein n=2 Tax=Gossypium TaxID=3633 RepID=A0A7J8SG88_GOSDV|nr:hypothetical protein [Gossypium davidsonii]MBA0660623.1 hypothetical protein [Gossypium klotzschianum]
MESFSVSASSPTIELQLYTFIQEQVFFLLMRNCKGIWENAIEREWTKFCLLIKEHLIIHVVQELYLA